MSRNPDPDPNPSPNASPNPNPSPSPSPSPNPNRNPEQVSVADQLRDALVNNAVRVIDLFREWDEDGDGTVSKKEFRKAIIHLGLEVPPG